MKLIGQATLVFRDVETGEITKELTKENNITNQHIEVNLAANASDPFGPTIFLSEFAPPGTSSDPNFKTATLVHPFGFVVTAPEVFPATDVDFSFGQYHHRFSAPPSDITINMIGLTDDTSIDANRVIDPVEAIVKLASPCIQLSTETLDVFYRIIAPYDYYKEPSPADRNTAGLSAENTDTLIDRLVLNISTGYFASIFSNWNGNLDFTKLVLTPAISNSQDSNTPYSSTVTKTANTDLQKYDIHTEMTIDKGIGALCGFFAWGAATSYTINPYARGINDLDTDVVQGIFGHRAAAALPFHDTNETALGTGTLDINGDSWTNPDFPKMYRIDVTGSGAVGVGTYQFRVRNHFGLVLNSYKDSFRTMASLQYENRHIYDDFIMAPLDNTGTTVEDRDRPVFMQYDTFGEAVAIRQDAIVVMSLQTETGVTFNVTNYPSFTPTDITQVTLDGGTIYVGCRDTGIYKIVDPQGTPVITKIDNTTTGLTGLATSNCYGVSYGNGRLWAMWDGGLASSADAGVTWTVDSNFSNATITGDYTLCKFIKADPTHADQRLAIVYDSGGTTQMELTMLWWNESGIAGIGTTGTTGDQFHAYTRNVDGSTINMTRYFWDHPWTYFLMLEPSPTGNKWGANVGSAATVPSQPSTLYPAYFTFGATGKVLNTSVSLKNYQGYCSWELDSGGDEVICVVANETTYQYVFSLYKDNDTFEVSKFRNSNDSLQGPDTISSLGATMYVGRMVHLSMQAGSTKPFYLINTMNEVGSVEGATGFQHLLYDKYGWNGSAWELNHAGSKTIQAAAEVLSDGVTVAFDDAGGTQTFVATDYYTLGVCQGVWLDGSTSIDHRTGMYYKKYVTGQTGLEAATLSASIRSPDIYDIFPANGDFFTWQDIAEANVSGDIVHINPALGTYTSGARSVEVLNGNTGLTNHAAKDTLHGRLRFGIYAAFGGDVNTKISCGLSPIGVIGTAINRDTIRYGMELVHLGSAVGNGQEADINIIENGVTVAAAAVRFNTQTTSATDLEIEILNDGTVNYYIWNNGATSIDPSIGPLPHEKRLIHTSVGASIVDYYVDTAMQTNAGSYGFNFIYSGAAILLHSQRYTDGSPKPYRRFSRRVPDDLYHVFGEFANSNGRYLPNFFAVDSSQGLSVLIGGVEAQRIADNDISAVLLTGEISVFPREGMFRYSGSDTTKTVTATYSCLTTE